MLFTAILVGIVIIGIIVVFFVFRGAAKTSTGVDAGVDPQAEKLRYPVPDMQDPVVLVVALEQAGFVAVSEDVAAQNYLVVECPEGRDRDRERVRTIIRESSTTSVEGPEFDPGTVKFEDER